MIWKQVVVIVVLALTSLSSTAVVAALSVPHRDQPTVYITPYVTPLEADLCSTLNVHPSDQVRAAIEWAENGGPLPLVLSTVCSEDDLNLAASFADRGGESGVRFEQYMAAIEGRLSAKTVSRSDQYLAAIKWAEEGGEAPLILSMGRAEDNLDRTVSFVDYGGESGERFEQYMAAIEGKLTPKTVSAFEQYQAAVKWSVEGGPAPFILTLGHSRENWERFEQYMAAIER